MIEIPAVFSNFTEEEITKAWTTSVNDNGEVVRYNSILDMSITDLELTNEEIQKKFYPNSISK